MQLTGSVRQSGIFVTETSDNVDRTYKNRQKFGLSLQNYF